MLEDMTRRDVWLSGIVILVIVAGVGWMARGAIRERLFVLQRPTLPVAQPFVSSSMRTAEPATSSVVTIGRHPTSTRPVSRTATSTTKGATSTNTTPLAQVNLAVPFLSQAPKQNWAMPYQEACEEASMVMVDAYLGGRTKAFSPDEGDAALLALLAYEDTLHLKPDLTADEVKQVTEGYFSKRQVEVTAHPTVETIQAALSAGYPVIVPANGKTLGNPNFRNGGPTYHMLVIKGYLKDGRWITNDPGTHNGADYIYDQNVLMNAIHDWNGGDVPNGTPVMIVVK